MLKLHFRKVIIFLFVSLILVFFVVFDVNRYLNLDFFLAQREVIMTYGYLSVLIIIGLYAGVSILYLPIAFLSIFSGYLYGFFWGGLVAYIGGVLNILLAFLFARYLLRDVFLSWRKKLKVMDDIAVKLSENGSSFVFYARLFFLTPYNSLNIVCGISDISFKDYAIASALGAILQAFFYSYVGSSITEMMQTRENMITEGLTISVVIIVFFGALHFGKNRLKKNLDYS